MKRIFALISGALLTTAVLLFAVGCASFDRKWKGGLTVGDRSRGLEGCWSGSWKSERNGHSGKLLCVITRADDNHYRANFRATYWKILTFNYAVTLEVKKSKGSFGFVGSADLGSLAGGVYKYSGTADTQQFSSTYDSKYDSGEFKMRRADY